MSAVSTASCVFWWAVVLVVLACDRPGRLVGVAGRGAIGHGLVPVLPRVPAAGHQYLSAQARLSAYFDHNANALRLPPIGLCFKVRTFTLLAFSMMPTIDAPAPSAAINLEVMREHATQVVTTLCKLLGNADRLLLLCQLRQQERTVGGFRAAAPG